MPTHPLPNVRQTPAAVAAAVRAYWAGALLLCCGFALAQPTEPAPPSVEHVAALDTHGQRQWLDQAYASRMLSQASDAQLTALLAVLDWRALLDAPQQWLRRNPDYTFVMLRQERLRESDPLPPVPERIAVRYRHQPRALYAQWLAGGPRQGQEVLYDSTVDPQTVRAHLGGWLGFVRVTVAIDGVVARTQSRHSVRDIGFQYIFDQFNRDMQLLKVRGAPSRVSTRLAQEGSQRVLELTIQTPGAPDFYARTTRMQLELDRPVLRLVECRDNDGLAFERLAFEQVKAGAPAPDAFDPANPAYHF